MHLCTRLVCYVSLSFVLTSQNRVSATPGFATFLETFLRGERAPNVIEPKDLLPSKFFESAHHLIKAITDHNNDDDKEGKNVQIQVGVSNDNIENEYGVPAEVSDVGQSYGVPQESSSTLVAAPQYGPPQEEEGKKKGQKFHLGLHFGFGTAQKPEDTIKDAIHHGSATSGSDANVVYGEPIEVNTISSYTSGEYGAPSASSQDYGAPSVSSNKQHAAPSQGYGTVNQLFQAPIASQQYGAPASQQYGAPNQQINSNYGAPAPNSNYGAPTPNSNYGAPTPNSNYGAPTPNSNYGAPTPNSNYGAPTPNSNYGAPVAQNQQYGAPAVQNQQYGAPAPNHQNQQYGAPSVNQYQYGAPAPTRNSHANTGYNAVRTINSIPNAVRNQNQEYGAPQTQTNIIIPGVQNHPYVKELSEVVEELVKITKAHNGPPVNIQNGYDSQPQQSQHSNNNNNNFIQAPVPQYAPPNNNVVPNNAIGGNQLPVVFTPPQQGDPNSGRQKKGGPKSLVRTLLQPVVKLLPSRFTQRPSANSKGGNGNNYGAPRA